MAKHAITVSYTIRHGQLIDLIDISLQPQHHQDVPEPLARYMAVKCLKGEVALAEESAAKQKAEYLQMKSWVNEKSNAIEDITVY